MQRSLLEVSLSRAAAIGGAVSCLARAAAKWSGAGVLLCACSALAQTGLPAADQSQSSAPKIASSGIYKDGTGAAHSWEITPAHALIWDKAAYMPVGCVFAAKSLDHEGEEAYKADIAALDALKAHGVRDVLVACVKSLGDVAPDALQKLVTYLDASEFRYGLTFGQGISRPLVGTVVRPTVYRYFEKDGVTATWQVSNTDAGLFAIVDADSGNKLLRADYVAVNSSVVTLPLDTTEAIPGRKIAQFYPHKALMGDNTLPDLWGGFDDYRDRLLGVLGKVKFGKGLRFFQDPLGRHLGLAGEADFTVPDSRGFRLEWEAFLTQRYGSVDRIEDAWSVTDGKFKSIKAISYLVPLWEKTHGIPYFFNPASGDKLRIVDAGRSRWWSDFLELRDNSIYYYMNTMADVLKKEAANVPVIYTWTQSHPIFLNREKVGGYDGLSVPARGGGNALLTRSLIPGYSHVEQGVRALWAIATEIDSTQAAAVRPAPVRGTVVTGAVQSTQSGASSLSLALDGIRRVGLKGFFIGSLPGGPKTDDTPASPAESDIEGLREYAARIGSEPSAARYAPRILFYPQSAPGPAHPGPIPGSSVLWMGSYQGGDELDWWPSYDGYTQNNNQVSVLVSLQGRRETHIWVPQPKLIEATTADGTPVPIKLVNKSEFVVWLDSTPTIFHTGGQRLVIQEAAQDAYAQLNGLYSEAQDRRLPELEAIRNIVDTIQRKYAEKDFENAYTMCIARVNELTAMVQPYTWVEGEFPRVSTFDEVARNPEVSGRGFLNLYNHNDPPQKYEKYGYGAYYSLDVPKEGVYNVWLAGSLPGPSVSPILWRIDAPPDLNVADSTAHGPKYLGDRFGWMQLGVVRLTQGQHQLEIYVPERAASPAVYSFSIDAIMITPGIFHPNGALRPAPIDADELKKIKLKKPEKKDPPSKIDRNFPSHK